ncbi:MAG: hypothetical protein MZV64_34465 [Ignavibacteriales bacterium]|nr:hypothetical protein [Ignavibacteriales bacterium]
MTQDESEEFGAFHAEAAGQAQCADAHGAAHRGIRQGERTRHPGHGGYGG